MLGEHLAEADEHIALGTRHISDQLARIAKLKSGGHDTTNAESLLKIMQETQATREQHRKRLLQQLGE